MKKIIPTQSVLIPDNATRVFQGQIFDVYQWPQKLFDGSQVTFEMLKRPDTVISICIANEQILVVNDEQPHRGTKKSFPGGRIDATDVSIEAAARREVQEETGYTFNRWRLIEVWQPHTKTEWFIHMFLATDVAEQVPTQVDPGEKITLERYDFDQLKALVVQNVGYLGNAGDVITKVDSIDQLMSLPAFSGQTVDR